MPATVEQLWFTWAETGLERRNGFQIRAASPGFADLSSNLTTTARRLCTYTPPRRTDPATAVSYGWINAGAVRFVFRRVDAGVDAYGRRGRFFAHIVAGTPTALSADWIIRRYNSPFWRSDATEDESTLLPTVTTADVTDGDLAAVDDVAVGRFRAAVLDARRTRRRLAVVAPSEVVAALVAATTNATGINGLAVSTYEPSGTADNFDIVGVAAATDGPPRSAVFTLDAAGRDNPELIRLGASVFGAPAGTTTDPLAALFRTGSGEEVRALVDAGRALDALGWDRDPTYALIAPALAHPATASAVLDDQTGARIVARQLAGADPDAWNTVVELAGSVDTDVWTRFAEPLASALWDRITHSPAPRTVAATLAGTRRVGETLADGAVDALVVMAVADPAPLSLLGTDDKAALLSAIAAVPATRHGLSDPVVDALITPVRATDTALLTDAAVPVPWRARGASGLAATEPDHPILARLAATDPALVVDALASLDDTSYADAVAVLVGRCDPGVGFTFASVAGHRLQPQRADVAHLALAGRLPRAQADSHLARWLDGRPAHSVGDDVVAAFVAAFTAGFDERLGGRTRPLVDASTRHVIRDLADRSSYLAVWDWLITNARHMNRGMGLDAADRELGVAIRGLYDSLGQDRRWRHDLRRGGEWLADWCTGACRTRGDVELLRNRLAPYIDDRPGVHAQRVLRAVARDRDDVFVAAAALPVLAWTLGGIDGRSISGPAVEAVAADAAAVAAMLDGDAIERITAYAADRSKASKRWLASVIEAATTS